MRYVQVQGRGGRARGDETESSQAAQVVDAQVKDIQEDTCVQMKDTRRYAAVQGSRNAVKRAGMAADCTGLAEDRLKRPRRPGSRFNNRGSWEMT